MIRDDREIAIEEVVVDDILLVSREKVPVDGGRGRRERGRQSMITGEPIPVGKREGDGVVGGT